ncbi:MAG: glycosyltransferase family 2 protein [Acidobacteria bacterium]|nr:glycosyltransferase family 2 protein [Acidobacteriota bacterium]
MLQFSIIIPTLNEAAHISETLRALEPYASACEVIVVDGGSRDETVALASGYTWARVIEFGTAQRAAQMNAGAAVARGEVLLFLHADVRLPTDFISAIQTALRDEQCVGGCFAFGFPAEVTRAFHVYARGINWRTHWGWNASGDQALWVRREVFEQLGGFRSLPMMEDLEFFAALKQRGRVALLKQQVIVSPRRWQKRGLIRTALLMYALRFGHWLGIAPAALKRFFLEVR